MGNENRCPLGAECPYRGKPFHLHLQMETKTSKCLSCGKRFRKKDFHNELERLICFSCCVALKFGKYQYEKNKILKKELGIK